MRVMTNRAIASLAIVPFLLFGCAESTEQSNPDGSVPDSAMALDGTTPRPDGSTGEDGSVIPVTDGAVPDSSVEVDLGIPPAMDGGVTTTDSGLPMRDGSILPPRDAGDPFGDAGELGTPVWVPVEVRTSGMCDDLMPCGGPVEGTWDVTGACISIPIGSALGLCPGAEITYAGGMARGRVTFEGGSTHRVAQSEVEADAFVPASCASFIGGCPGVASALAMASADSTCVDDGDGNCNCAIRQSTDYDDSGTYTTTDTQIMTSGGKTYDYCISGTSLTYEDVTPGSAMSREPGIVTLGMR